MNYELFMFSMTWHRSAVRVEGGRRAMTYGSGGYARLAAGYPPYTADAVLAATHASPQATADAVLAGAEKYTALAVLGMVAYGEARVAAAAIGQQPAPPPPYCTA